MILYLMMGIVMMMMVMMIVVMAAGYKRVPPNKAMVVYGHKFQGGEGIMILTGGGRFIMPVIEQCGWLDLEVRTLNISVTEVITRDYNVVNVECTSQVQIDPSEDGLKTAAVMLLQKTPEEIEYVAQRTLEGHIRGICATLTLPELHRDLNHVGTSIGSLAGEDLMNMGIAVVSCVIRNVTISDDKTDEDAEGAGGTGNPTQAALLMAKVNELEDKIAELEDRLGLRDEAEDQMEGDQGETEDGGEEPPPPPAPAEDDLPPPPMEDEEIPSSDR